MKLTNFQKGLVLFLAAFILLGGTLFVNRILQADVFSKEEAQHALYSLWLYKDIRGFDLANFWNDTQRQMFWPFFHSWIQSASFLFLGVSYTSARILSLAIFFLTLLLMYITSERLCPKSGWKIGVIASLLALSSPIMLKYATANTLEGLGALIFLLAFYYYANCEQCKRTIDYVLLGVIMGLSLYTNYLYAYLMIPSFIVMTLGKLSPITYEVIKLERKGEKAALPFFWWAYRKLIVLVVLAVFVAFWFFSSAFSRKIMLLMQAIFRYSGGEMLPNVWQALIYYPRVIVESYTFSPWLGLLVLISLFLPFVAFQYREFGKLYTFIWTVIILATLTIPTKAVQFIYIVAPFMFMVTAAAVIHLAERLEKRWVVGMGLVICLPALLSLPKLASAYFPDQPKEKMIQVLDYYRQNIRPRHSLAASFNLQHLASETVAFHFWDWNAPVIADPIIEPDEMLRSADYLLGLEINNEETAQQEVLDDSAYRWQAFLQEKMRQGEIKESSGRQFPELGVTAKIYQKVNR
ncbi:MAG: glycosyltransferase family 39 protein [Candidatus Margulisbacteria bacterium]|nr:glycosyltransferase family 39 protein [Candidatus Margulisiibacteriota bacterium]